MFITLGIMNLRDGLWILCLGSQNTRLMRFWFLNSYLAGGSSDTHLYIAGRGRTNSGPPADPTGCVLLYHAARSLSLALIVISSSHILEAIKSLTAGLLLVAYLLGADSPRIWDEM